MKDCEKRELARWVKYCIDNGLSKSKTIEKLKGLGWKQHTIGTYYKVFSEV